MQAMATDAYSGKRTLDRREGEAEYLLHTLVVVVVVVEDEASSEAQRRHDRDVPIINAVT